MTTSPPPFPIFAGAGFARMAWELAKRRAGVPLLPKCFEPDREHAKLVGKSSWHYYRILDSATAAWTAFAAERSLGICPRIYL